MKPEIRAILDELKREFEAIYGDRLVQMILYGSQARGDAEPDSDIDVLVVLEGEVLPGAEIRRTGEVTSEICLDHDAVISRLFVSADEYLGDVTPLFRNVRREGVGV